MSDFPTPEQELDRKVVWEIERLVHGLQTRKVGLQEAAASLLTLWNIVSGLIPQDTMEILGNVTTGVRKRAEERGDAEQLAFLLGGPGGAYVVRRDQSAVTIIAWVGDQNTKRVARAPLSETFPERWAAEHFDKTVKELNQQGYFLLLRQ